MEYPGVPKSLEVCSENSKGARTSRGPEGPKRVGTSRGLEGPQRVGTSRALKGPDGCLEDLNDPHNEEFD